MEATDEFIYTKHIPEEPDAFPAQTIEVNGETFILGHHFKHIKIVSHRYCPLIPMSVDEQEVPPEVSPSMAATIPQLVHDQLATQFLPASKNMGQAGMHLLKAYYMFQEALSNYCDATHKLIKSADTAGHKSKSEARELSTVFKQFVQGVNAHQKIIMEFDTLAHKVQDYSNKEKEKLKAEFAEYKKEEKKIQKRKGGETEKEIAAFYRKAAADWSRQQELRYKFFNDKIHSWINGYIDIGKLFLPTEVAAVAIGEGTAPDAAEVKASESPEHWHEELHENAAVVAAEEAKSKPTLALSETDGNRSDSTSSIATTLEDLPSARRHTNETDGVTLVSKNRRNSIEILPSPPLKAPIVDRAPPLLANTHPPAIHPKPVEKNYAPIRDVPVPAPRHEEYAHRHQNVVSNQLPEQPNNNAPGGGRRAGSSIPGAVNVFGFANQSNPQPNVRYTPVPVQNNGAPYQVVTSDHIRVGRVVENPITEEQMNAKKFHVDANYLPMASPSHQAQRHSRTESADISVPSFFNPSQYGSILIVNDDFNASSGEQMTVNRGDKVILLKCGSRGWVFVRDSISNRTGWVPEPYVNP